MQNTFPMYVIFCICNFHFGNGTLPPTTHLATLFLHIQPFCQYERVEIVSVAASRRHTFQIFNNCVVYTALIINIMQPPLILVLATQRKGWALFVKDLLT